ncbi:MAG: Pyrimidine-nucleoside phosphorylase [Synergistetes bacterium ADurb.Bin155]|jgi:pyrimidine-nucleoside phosphorylase|nr:thymidine phosphorylase [Synergistales bacterium]OQB47285.1 MAG: Pyrimidine-nucleoside phosphorylase [Synergistetes bacterium ADurb.Bin155]HOC82954.1 thymidine phosphorylase [Synergistales bacterium]
MNPVAFIEDRRDGKGSTPQEIAEFVRLAHGGEIPDYQVAAWLMAVFFRGMTRREVKTFTEALSLSGKVVTFPGDIFPVDKHSTGGVGDKTSLVVVPLAAACGVPVAKLSGRGLGFTGGTVDKLESIPGFSAHLDLGRFVEQVTKVGCAISGHSEDLAPAEALFYELRDVTGTVPSIPLITSSIVSKKMAGGSRAFVFDVKCGTGAFMKDKSSALELSESLVGLSASLGRKAMALVTAMDQPLGRWVGNAAEVAEAVEVLLRKGPGDVRDLSLRLAASMVHLGGLAGSPEEAGRLVEEALDSGRAYGKFEEMVHAQGGDLEAFNERAARGGHLADATGVIEAVRSGVVTRCDAKAVGESLRVLGGGRLARTETVDPGAACHVLKKIGDPVTRGEPLARAYFSVDESRWSQARRLLEGAFEIGGEAVSPALVIDTVESGETGR